MDNENTNQETAAEVEQRAAYIRSLVRPSVNSNKNGRKVWSIDLETFWVRISVKSATRPLQIVHGLGQIGHPCNPVVGSTELKSV